MKISEILKRLRKMAGGLIELKAVIANSGILKSPAWSLYPVNLATTLHQARLTAYTNRQA